MRRAPLTIAHYRNTRFWGLYESGVLLCVTVYKKGAEAVRKRIESGEPLAAPALAPLPEPPPQRRTRRTASSRLWR